MKLEIVYGSEAYALPAAVVNYMDKADPLALRLMLLLVSDKQLRENFSYSDMARAFAVSKEEIEKALEFWARAGVAEIKEDGGKSKRAETEHVANNGAKITVVHSEGNVSYTGDELVRIFGERPSLSNLMDECSRIAGKMFSVSESNKIIGLVDYLRLEPEYVMMLFTYCKKIDKCSVHYVEKTAYNLYNEGIVTYTALEASLAEMEKHRSFEGKLRTLMGLGTRALTATEKKYMKLWCDLQISDELLTLAYDTSVNNTGAPSMPYMNKVLSNWREAGYTSRDDVERASLEYKKKKESAGLESFNTDEFFEAALERSYKAFEGK